ncbi:alpha-(1,6)-fucosyltransferase-like [Lytechinus variegatus]|uniref:alpha-(1,6)-fucosyltransferase-like n=1 Tax=Lytechinus variegatus TaxID=7654 RepID=UPI001BB12873|nr:alpha-(1,6)-fucosyltransferase-like [Lytechinus variegatus]XP_041472108.1 alpha-(1,6)-fucosyltransferase-like [Lytechinus variegatus]
MGKIINVMVFSTSALFFALLEYSSWSSQTSYNPVKPVDRISRTGGDSSWKESGSKRLSTLIQKRLYSLQNPSDCAKARKIVCTFNKRCGFGCQTHHVSYCMIMAYGTGRTLILQSKGWDYDKEGWEKFFQPLSETCRDPTGVTRGKWTTPDNTENPQVLAPPLAGYLTEDLQPDFLPLAIPADIADELRRFHSNPSIWWIGEIMTYIMRPKNHTKDLIDKAMAGLGFTHPIVGIHVRRTDKLIWEAKFHGIEEYMVHAIDFYEDYERREGYIGKRRIFLATDDVGLLAEARKKYPDYMFLNDVNITGSAQKSLRSSAGSLQGIISDIHLLASSDFLVCTFSSNVCRLAYEMMQHYHVDASSKAHSVDIPYYWHGQKANSSGKAVMMPLPTSI